MPLALAAPYSTNGICKGQTYAHATFGQALQGTLWLAGQRTWLAFKLGAQRSFLHLHSAHQASPRLSGVCIASLDLRQLSTAHRGVPCAAKSRRVAMPHFLAVIGA